MANGKAKRGKVVSVLNKKDTDTWLLNNERRIENLECWLDTALYVFIGYLVYRVIHVIVFRGRD